MTQLLIQQILMVPIKQNMKGFTLIELMVVVAIMILFSGLSLAYYNDFTVKQKLDASTRKVIDALELAKKKAAAGDTSLCTGGVGITPVVNKYTIEVTSNTAYSLVPDCTAGTPVTYNYPTLAAPIEFVTSPLSVDFNSLNVDVSGDQYIHLQNTSDNTKCSCINIQTSGLIDELTTCSDGTCP